MSTSNNVTVKKTKGRQKLEIKKMEKERNLQVTFSKRRNGVFKKASELCTLCDVDVAVVFFSPGNKVFSFGKPNIDNVIHRYLSLAPPLFQTSNTNLVGELNMHLNHLSNQIDAETKRDRELAHFLRLSQGTFWWACPIENMNGNQLQHMKAMLEALKKLVTHQTERLLIQDLATRHNAPQFFSGSSSYNINRAVLNPPLQQNPVFDGNMMHHLGFNNGYGPATGGGLGFY